MASPANRSVALLAIQPQYAKAILNGSKRVEFRKTRFKRQVSHVVMYCTSPVMRVLGVFEIGRIESGAPSDLWHRYQSVGGIGADDFAAYYSRSKVGIALEVARVWILAEPLELTELADGLSPPQSYCYLGDECVTRLWQRVPADHGAPRAASQQL